MEHESVFPGMRVKYSPSPGHEFDGMAASEPWLIGDTWVTKLVDMEDAYSAFTGKKGDKATTVFAAALHAMRMACGTMPRPDGLPAASTYRCNICGGVVAFDGTPPVPGNWGGRT